MTGFRSFLVALSALAISSGPSAAASSPWVETEGGRVRLVVLPEEADGHIPALLDIELQPGWKTYWRDPGESGISPSITIPRQSGLTLEKIHFPVPKHFDDGFTRYTGYDRSITLPLSLRRQAGTAGVGDLTTSIFLGICQNICIPVQADLSVNLADAARGNLIETAMSTAAVAALPQAPSSAFTVTQAQWHADGKTLSVTFTAPEPTPGKPLQVFVSGPDGFQFDPAAVPVRAGHSYRVDVALRHKPKEASLADAAILFTAESGGQAMEMPLAID